MAQQPASRALITQAEQLVRRGYSVEQAAAAVGLARVTLYRAGVRSSRGYGRG